MFRTFELVCSSFCWQDLSVNFFPPLNWLISLASRMFFSGSHVEYFGSQPCHLTRYWTENNANNAWIYTLIWIIIINRRTFAFPHSFLCDLFCGENPLTEIHDRTFGFSLKSKSPNGEFLVFLRFLRRILLRRFWCYFAWIADPWWCATNELARPNKSSFDQSEARNEIWK